MADPDIGQHLTAKEIDRCFDLRHTIKKVDYIFKRVFKTKRK
jgi:adenylosuccinate lyase